MIDTTTRLNTPGPELAALPGVHALTDVTGFGLAGHALEMARGAGCSGRARLGGRAAARRRARAGGAGLRAPGASGRNWAGYGQRGGAAGTASRPPTRRC
jgi:selenide,water dikinase